MNSTAFALTTTIFAALTATATATVTAAAEENVDLNVTRVALFSSGVAYFECDTTITDNATAELTFRTEQINDIIKSLIVQDFDGGSIGAVSYASQDPIEKTLKSFGVDITGKPTLGQLLDQLRGQPVEISGDRTLAGVIVGVEQRQRVVGELVFDEELLNILTEKGVQQLILNKLGGIRLTDEKIADELRKALATLATGADATKKSVELRFNGSGERHVRVAYLLEAPIWKTSYRLALEEEKQPFLQGWATVENATERDWRDVQLSLISGRPISFKMDLYTPIYIPRPVEELELYASLRPPTYEGAMEEKRKAVTRMPPGGMQPSASPMETKSGARLGGGRFRARSADADELEEMAGKSFDIALGEAGVESVASAADAGELFEYTIRAPVSIPRQHSAMLPIVNQPITGTKVSIYNPATHPKHPLNGLQITNKSGLHLMQGPVTVFDGNVYAGDAKLPDLKPDEKRLIAYALDLSSEVVVRRQPKPDELLSLKIVKGTMIQERKYVDAREYVVKNKSDRLRTVLIEQPYGDEWKLREPDKPYERTARLSRFKLDVPARQTATQQVTLEQISSQTIALTNLGSDRIQIYLRSRVVSQAVKDALTRIVALRTELDRVSRARQRAEREAQEAAGEQKRIRENIRTLQANTDAHARQMRKFDEIETEIENLRRSLRELRRDEEQKRKALEDYLLSLNVD